MSFNGSCYCGAVTFEVSGDLSGVIVCHCRDCQRTNGNSNALVVAPKKGVSIDGADHVQWFESSPGIRRSFCDTCGTRLFKDKGTDRLLISAGIFEPQLTLGCSKELFEQSKATWM